MQRFENIKSVVDIRQMNLHDLSALHKFCCEVYTKNFQDHWNEGGLEQYVDTVFGINVLEAELCQKNIEYYMAFINGEPAGFMKLKLSSNLPGFEREEGIELDKIYILPKLKGMKIGKRLMDVSFDIAIHLRKKICWLSVIDTNLEAISFYKKAGFKFHSKARLDYPKFKEELKGMWRMYLELPVYSNP